MDGRLITDGILEFLQLLHWVGCLGLALLILWGPWLQGGLVNLEGRWGRLLLMCHHVFYGYGWEQAWESPWSSYASLCIVFSLGQNWYLIKTQIPAVFIVVVLMGISSDQVSWELLDTHQLLYVPSKPQIPNKRGMLYPKMNDGLCRKSHRWNRVTGVPHQECKVWLSSSSNVTDIGLPAEVLMEKTYSEDAQETCSWKTICMGCPVEVLIEEKLFVWGSQQGGSWRKIIRVHVNAHGKRPLVCGVGYPAEMLMEEDYSKGVPRRGAHVIIIIMVVQFDGIGSTRKHCTPVLHASLSCGSLPDRLHSLKSLFTHSDHVFLRWSSLAFLARWC